MHPRGISVESGHAVRILIADDNQAYRDQLASLIRTQADFVLVGMASDGEEAVAKVEQFQPDVVLMDQKMPKLTGIEATRRIKSSLPTTRVIFIAAEGRWTNDAMRAGAERFFLKDDDLSELLTTIRDPLASLRPIVEEPRRNLLKDVLENAWFWRGVGLIAFVLILFAFLRSPRLMLVRTALFFGLFFFAYGLKYYASVALILFATSGNGNGNRNGNWNVARKINGWMNGKKDGKGRGSWSTGGLNGLGQANGGNGRLPAHQQPFISIHLPLYNELQVVDRLLTACTSMDYENYEVIVADDSTDETTQILRERWASHPRVKLSHREDRSGFKGGALKIATERMDPRTEFIAVFDADFVPPPDILHQFLAYFYGINGNHAEGKRGDQKPALIDEKVAVVQGYQWHILNASENWITRGVRSEYSGSYVIERSGQELIGSMKMISGSVFMIRADVLRQIGWRTSITEDWELTIRLHLHGYRVLYTPFIQAPAECVANFKQLARQRMRWAEGHTFNIKKYFMQVMTSRNINRREKAEFLYYAPYYLQSVFFIIGTLAWLISQLFFNRTLAFWTETLGWSLVFVNAFSLIVMNLTGLFLERGVRRNIGGLFSFVILTYLLVPYQAYAALKGLFEPHEGGWHRTKKTGVITEVLERLGMRRRLPRLRPKRKGLAPGLAIRLAFSTKELSRLLPPFFKRFANRMQLRHGVAFGLMVCVLLLLYLSMRILVVSAAPDIFYLRGTNGNGATPAGQDMEYMQGFSEDTLLFDSVDDEAYWYTAESYPTEGEETTLVGGEYALNLHFGQLPDAWWDTDYLYRMQITVPTYLSAADAGYSVPVAFDHKALVDSMKSLESGDDVRLVHWNGSSWTELERALDPLSKWNDVDPTQLWFKLVDPVSSPGTISDYYLYYGKSSALSPPDDWATGYPPKDEFSDGTFVRGITASEEDAPFVKINVSIYHTQADGSLPQAIVSTSGVKIDANSLAPFELSLGSGLEQTFTSADPQRLRIHIDVIQVNGGGCFTLAYDSASSPSSLNAPAITVTDVALLLLGIVVLIPIITLLLTYRRRLPVRIACVSLSIVLALALLSQQVLFVSAAPDVFYLRDTTANGASPAGEDMNSVVGASEDTHVFDSVDDEVYWYTDVAYPTGGDDASIAAGDYTLNMYFDSLPATWYDSAWLSRKKLTLDATLVATDFTTFPVLVSMTDGDLIGNTQVDGGDILFTSSNGTTKLDHEIESYDSGTGALVAWVEVQNLSGSTDTEIYMYYDNAGAADQWNPSGVWDSNYIGVWHLDESGDGTLNEFQDSTANNNHGTGGKGYYNAGSGYVPTSNTGQIGNGQTFDGTNDLIDMASSGWFDANWPYRKRILIQGDEVSGTADLSNFPVLISFSPNSDNDMKYTGNGGHVGKDDGTDIFFTNDEGAKLDHEIETYNPATGQLIAWVEATGVSPYENTTIYMYYGNATATDQQNVNGTWDAGYRGVWHLDEDPTDPAPQFLDSTSTPNNGTAQPVGDEPTQTAGKIDGSLAFDDQLERHVAVADEATLQLATDMTVSAWIKTSDSESDVGLVVNKWGSLSADRNYWLGKLNATSLAFYVDDTQNVTAALNLVNDGAWHYIVGVADATGTELRFYVDGSEQPTAAYDANSVTGTSDLHIGNASGSATQEFDGVIDEVRVSGSIRTADWIATEYSNQNNPSNFYQILSEETPSDITLDLTGTALTLEAWVRYNSGATDTMGYLTKNGWSDGYRVTLPTSNRISYQLPGDTNTLNSDGTLTASPDWHYVVTTYDGATMKTYIDGSQDVNTQSKSSNIERAGKEFWIGHGDHAILKNWSFPWSGEIDEVRVSDSARSLAWIQTSHNNHTKQGTGEGQFIKTLGVVESAPTVDIVVSVYHTLSDGSDPQEIITSSTVTIDSSTPSFYPLDIGSGAAQTFLAENPPRRLRVHIDVAAVSGGGSFTLAYDSALNASSLNTPSMVVSDVTLLLIAVVILIPIVMNMFTRRRRLAFRIASFVISLIAVVAILGQQVLPTLAAPDTFYLHDSTAGGAWYDPGWSYRKKITIYASQVTADESYFPVLINLSSDAELVASAQSDGGDIVFTSANGTTKLDHEIEKYLPGTGRLVAWVEVPSLSGSVNTELYMYYGNGTVADQWNVNGTWDDNFVVVHHFNDLNDSTQYGNNGINDGAAPTTAGIAGDAYDFDAATDNIEIADDTTLDLTGNHTLAAWIYGADNDADYQSVVVRNNAGNNDWDYALAACADGDTALPNYYNEYDILASSVDVNNNDWTYLVATWNGTSRIIYVDGQNRGSDGNNPWIENNSNSLFIGDSELYGEGYVGIIDEVRVSDTARTASWIETSFNNLDNPSAFYNIGSQETPGISPVGKYMNITPGSGGATLIFDSTDDEAYWYTELAYPTGEDDANIAAGAYTLDMHFDSLPGGGSTPQVDTVSTGIVEPDSLTISHTTSGTDRLMLVGISFDNDDYETVSSVTYNGVNLSLVGTAADSDDSRVEIWRLIAPATGTNDVVITFSEGLRRTAIAGVMTFTGVDQATPLGTFAGANGTSLEATVPVSSATNELVFDTVACETCTSLTVGAGQTQRWNLSDNTGGTWTYGGGSTEPGAATVTMSWDLGSSDHWAIGGVPVKPSGGSPPAPDAVSTGITERTSLTISHTTSGTDRLMLVGVALNNDNYETVSSITYNDVALSSVGTVNQLDDARVEIWRLVAPATGTHDVVITFSDNLYRTAVVGVTTFTGVDQGTPLGTFASNTGLQTTPATVDVTSATNELVFDTVACEDGATLTVDGSQTQQWNVTTTSGGPVTIGGGSTEAGAASVTMSWDVGDIVSASSWAIGGVSIKPASASVDIIVSVYHTDVGGGDPQEIVTSSTITIDADTLDPYELPIGSGSEQTFTSADPRLVRVHIDVTAINGGGSFTLAYDSATNDSALDTPAMVVPDATTLLVIVVIFIPILISLFMRKRRLALRLASIGLSLVIALTILSQQILPVTAAPDVFYLHDTDSQSGSVNVQVAASTDDAEESLSGGGMDLTSSDLELIREGSTNNQEVGMRFLSITIPQGAKITNAYIEFEADEADTETTNLVFWGQDSDDTTTFTSATNDITDRPKTTASVAWNDVPEWVVDNNYQTPDLSLVIQEIVDRSGWASGNSMVIIVTGSGQRVADSYNKAAPRSPALLHIEYSVVDPSGKYMNITPGSAGSTMLFDELTDEAYWYTELTYPTGGDDGSIVAGDYNFKMYFDQLPAEWWDTTYLYRHQIEVTTTTAAVDAGYSVSISFNHANLVTNSKSLDTGDDVRVVHWTGSIWVELDRALDPLSNWNSATTLIWFALEDPIAASSSDNNYYLYYGNAAASNPPEEWANVFMIGDEFDNGALSSDLAVSTAGTASISETSGEAFIDLGTEQTTDAGIIVAKNQLPTDNQFAIKHKTKLISGGGISNPEVKSIGIQESVGQATVDTSTNENPRRRIIDFTRVDTNAQIYYFSASEVSHYWDGAAWQNGNGFWGNLSLDTYYIHELISDGTDWYVRISDAGGIEIEVTTPILWSNTYDTGNPFWFYWGEIYTDYYYGDQKSDWVYVRDYVDPEPTAALTGLETDAPYVRIVVSVYHTTSNGSNPIEIVTSTSYKIDCNTANPFELTIGAGAEQTFTAADPQRLRAHVDVTAVNGSGSFTLAYDSSADPSWLETPTLTVPEWSLLFMLLVPLIPFLMTLIWRRKRLAMVLILILAVFVSQLSMHATYVEAFVDEPEGNRFQSYTTPLVGDPGDPKDPPPFGPEDEHGFREKLDSRTRNSKTMQLFEEGQPTDQFVWEGSMAPLHYQDAQGNWNEIRTTLLPSSRDIPGFGSAAWEMTENDYEIFVQSELGNGLPFVRFKPKRSGYWVQFTPRELQWTAMNGQNEIIASMGVNKPVVTGDEIVWSGVYGEGIDLRLETGAGRMLKWLDLAGPVPSPSDAIIEGGYPIFEYVETISYHSSLSIWANGQEWNEEGVVVTTGEIQFQEPDGDVAFVFPLPSVTDAGGKGVAGQYRLFKQGDELQLAVGVPLQWLGDAEYPVKIDPTVDVQVGGSTDDCDRWGATDFHCEYASLYLDYDDPNQSDGMHFSDVTIPNAATIDTAYLTVRSRATVASPTGGATIYGQAHDNPPTFTQGDYAEYDARVRTTANVYWQPSAWVLNTDYNSPEIKSIVQEIVDRSGWASGNDMVMFFVADQTEEIIGYAYDSSPTYAAKLHIEYSTSGSFDLQVSASTDDCDRDSVNWSTGANYFYLDYGNAGQSDGARFTNVDIPKGATITTAYMTIHSTQDPGAITGGTTIYGQDDDNPATFSTAVDYDGRPKTSASVYWQPAAWTLGEDFDSPDIKTVIQEIVDRPGWTPGNAIVLFLVADVTQDIHGYSYDGSTTYAPKLHIEYSLFDGVGVRVASSSDDCDRDNVNWSTTTSTFYLDWDSAGQADGVRFTNVAVPNGAKILSAYLTVRARDGVASVTGGATIYGQAADDPATFSTPADFNARTWTTANVYWQPSVWNADVTYDSPDISSVVQEIVDRPGWASGQAMAFKLDGDEVQHLYGYSYDYDVGQYAPRLSIEFILPPSAPSNCQATYVSDTQIDITWSDNSDNETGFKIERSVDGAAFAQIDTSPADSTSNSDTTTSADHSYRYQVRAYNDAGHSSYCTPTSLIYTSPAAPTGFNATHTANLEITLTWTDQSTYEDQFRIERDKNGGGYGFLANDTNGSPYVDNTITQLEYDNQDSFTYRIRSEISSQNRVSVWVYSNTVVVPEKTILLVLLAPAMPIVMRKQLRSSREKVKRNKRTEREPNEVDQC